MHNNQLYPGYSLIQLVMAIALLGIALAAAIPNFSKQKPSYQQKAFVTELNAFLAQAWQQGLVSQRVQKVVVGVKKREITLEQEVGEDDKDQLTFSRTALLYIPVVTIPESLEFQQFFVQGVDEFSAGASKRTTENIWFFMLPGGMAQEVIINMVGTQGRNAGHDDKEISLVLNPFTAQFKIYDVFQTPA